MKSCRNCLLPEAVPGADLDAHGICRPCRAYKPQDQETAEARRRVREADLENAIEACRGQGSYDCLVPLSGGKDSVYLIHKLKVEYGLRVLAHTTDIDIGEVAWANIRRAVDKLDVEHVVYRPSMAFYRQLFRWRHLGHTAVRHAAVRIAHVKLERLPAEVMCIETTWEPGLATCSVITLACATSKSALL